MKINHVGPMGVNPYKRQLDKQVNLEQSTRKTTDKVEISSAAKELQESLQITKERQEKVEEIKQQVQTGTYTIDSKEIAKGIYNFFNVNA